jgi:hypothetical protein
VSPERQRDQLGRPLPDGADPSLIVPSVSLESELSDDEAWAAAMDYLDSGMPFHAHEVFELRWRSAPDADRNAWQALAQWGAALTHEARGNSTGAVRVAKRALATLDSAPCVPATVDVAMVRESCRRLSKLA